MTKPKKRKARVAKIKKSLQRWNDFGKVVEKPTVVIKVREVLKRKKRKV